MRLLLSLLALVATIGCQPTASTGRQAAAVWTWASAEVEAGEHAWEGELPLVGPTQGDDAPQGTSYAEPAATAEQASQHVWWYHVIARPDDCVWCQLTGDDALLDLLTPELKPEILIRPDAVWKRNHKVTDSPAEVFIRASDGHSLTFNGRRGSLANYRAMLAEVRAWAHQPQEAP